MIRWLKDSIAPLRRCRRNAYDCFWSKPTTDSYFRFQKNIDTQLPKEQGDIVEAVTKSTAPLLKQKKCASWVSNIHFTVQSLDVSDTPNPTGQTMTSETVTFVDNSSGIVNEVEAGNNPIASQGATANTSLAKFLSRPTLIDTRTWSTADLVGYSGSTIEPWFLFLNNAVIKQKLTNYAFLRARLCVKVVINATPFHFGLMRVAYQPNVNAADTGDRKNMIRTNPT